MSKWNIDPDHSVAAFSVKHMMITNVHGQFNKIAGTIDFDPADIAGTSIEFKIDAAGILSGIQKRDDHLRSQEFFDVEKHPKITFKSTKCEVSNFNSCKVTGDLTVHGIKKSLTVEVEFFGSVKSPFDDTAMGFTVKTVLRREDFGLNWDVPLNNGGSMVGKDIQVFVDIEADLVKG